MTMFRPATEEDARYIGANLRKSDRLELERGASESSPSAAPLRSLEASIIAWTLVSPAGTPIAVFGVAPDRRTPQAGIVWLLGTPELARAGKTLVAKGRYYVGLMSKLFAVLHNAVDAENLSTRRWLRALGFEEGDTVQAQRTDHPFTYVFYQRHSDV